MSKKKSRRKKSKRSRGQNQGESPRKAPRFQVETVEPRILLSASWVDGTAGDDTMPGTAGDDCLDGLAGDDLLQGLAGDDVLRGGLGNDTIEGGAGTDRADYTAATGAVDVNLHTGQATGADGTDSLFSIENVEGSAHDDTLTGDTGSNWMSGGAGNDTISGGDGNDALYGAAGDDVIRGGAGDDTISGGAGTDTVDYSDAPGGVTVDLTITTAQSTGGGNTDTLIGMEGVIGSGHDDTFAFSSAVDGAVYTVDGGAGSNTIDLTGYDSSKMTFGDSTITVDMGAGESFQINYSNIDTIAFSDVNATVLSANANETSFSGSGIYIDGPQAFQVDVTGPGTIDWSYDVTTDTLDIDDTTGTDGTTAIVLTDLNGNDLTIGAIATDDTLGDLTTNVGVGSISITTNWEDLAGTVTIGGDLGSVSVSHDLIGTLDVQGNLGTAVVGDDIIGTINVSGDVGSLTLTGEPRGRIESTATVSVGGNLGSLDVEDLLEGTLNVQGNVGSMTVGDSITNTAVMTVGGDVTSMTVVGAVAADVTIAGDLDTANLGSVSAGVTIAAQRVVGTLVFNVAATDYGATYASPTNYEYADGIVATTPSTADTPPTADAGADQVVDEGDVVTLDASGSGDLDLDPLTYTWLQTSGPPVTLSDVNAQQPTFTAPDLLANTDIEFRLTVSDGTNDTVDTVIITVNADNDAPTAAAGADQNVNENDLVTLTGTGSTDPEGVGLTYSWVQTSGPTVVLSDATAAQPTFTAPDRVSNTAVTFELTVSDGVNSSSVDSVTVNIAADNDAPTAAAGPDQNVNENDLVTLTGTASTDPEGVGLTYSWVQTSGPTVVLSDATAAQPTFTAPDRVSNTAVTFELTVSDGVNNSSVDSVTVNIAADNDAPTAAAGPDQNVNENDLVTLTGTGSTDPEGVGLTYSWVQTSGPTVVLSDATAVQPTFTAPEGLTNTTVTFELTVSDGVNNSSVDAVTVNVAADNDAPTAAAGPDQNVNENDLVTLTGTGSTDPEGVGLTYSWVQTSGPTVVLSDATAAQPTFTAPEGLTNTAVTFELTVSDGVNNSSVDSVTVNIAADNDAPTAAAGPDQVVDEASVVSLDATGSTDPEGTGLTYSWTQTAGPAVVLSDTAAAQPSFISPGVTSPTTIEFQVQVNDGTNVVADTVQVTVNPQDLLANWTFDGAGQTVTDVTGHGNDGVLGTNSGAESSDPTRVNDPERGAVLAFDGNDFVDGIGQGPAGDFAVSVWAKDDGTGSDQWQAMYGTGTAEIWLGTNSSNGRIALHVGGENDWFETSPGAWSTDTWHHVVGTWDGTTAHIYLDGVDMALSVKGSPHDPVAADGALGVYSNDLSSEHWTGWMDDVRVYDSALDASEVDAIAGRPVALAGSDQAVTENDLVMLDGTASSDPEGTALTYSWVQTSGPAVVLSDATAAQPTFTAPDSVSNTSVSFELTVSDGVNVSSVDTVTVNITADNDAPTAAAGPDQNVNENDLVTLTGTGSTDPEGVGLTYSWVQTSGPTVVLSDATAAQPTFTAPDSVSNTAVTFELTVSDGVNVSSVDTVTVNIAADNDAPSSAAGPDQNVNENDLVTLTGTGSTDPEGVGLTYSWVQTSGPTVVLSDATAAQPTFTAPDRVSNTSVTFELTVSDGVNSSSVDTVTVNIAADNDAPSAAAGSDQNVNENDLVTLTGAGSTDPEGVGLTYSWVQTSGPTVVLSDATAAQPTFAAPEGLTNTAVLFELTVSDGVNVSSVDTVTVNIAADNDAPSAAAGPDQNVNENDLVTLNGVASTDPEGVGLTYSWVQTSGPTVVLSDTTAAQPTFTAPDSVSNTAVKFELTVSDGVNVSSVDSVTVNIAAANDAPTAAAGPDQNVDENDLVTLTGTGSTDPEGVGLTYSWVQTSGPAVVLSDATAAQPTFKAPDTVSNTSLTFELTVSDGVNNSSADTVSVMIGADNDAPTADAGADQRVSPRDSVQLSASGTDPEGQGLTFKWTQVSGPPVAISDSGVAQPTFEAPVVSGTTDLVFQVVASDGAHNAVDTVTVTIVDLAPVVKVGAAGVVAAGDQVNLSASATDPEGGALTYQWSQVSGPTVALSGASTMAPSFTAPELENGANLVFRVEVSDGAHTTTSTVAVTVQAMEPVTEDASSSAPTTQVLTTPADPEPVVEPPVQSVPDPVTADPTPKTSPQPETVLPQSEAEQSEVVETRERTDPSVAIRATQVIPEGGTVRMSAEATDFDESVSYTWKQVTGTPVSLSDGGSASPSFVAPGAAEDYQVVFEVTVTDGNHTVTDTVAIQVVADDAPASATGEPVVVVGSSGEEIKLVAPGIDPERGAMEFVWRQVSGTQVALPDVDSGDTSIVLPDVFVEEELVFEVVVRSGADEVVEEVRVEVKPVEDVARDTGTESSRLGRLEMVEAEAPQEQRGIGKLWAALTAFFRTSPTRMDDQ